MSNSFFNIEVDVNKKQIQTKIENLIDDHTMQQIHNLFAKIIDPWVPMDEGPLSQHIEVTPEYVRYAEPYAHYQYTGEVYAPNIPIIEEGIIVGWRSPPGKGTKHPTGRELGKEGELLDDNGNVIWQFGYSSKHSKSAKEWDKAAMEVKLDEFKNGVRDILIRRAKDLYG